MNARMMSKPILYGMDSQRNFLESGKTSPQRNREDTEIILEEAKVVIAEPPKKIFNTV